MKKLIFLFLSILMCFFSLGQTELFDVDLTSITKKTRKFRETVPIINEDNNDINLLFMNSKSIASILINDDFKIDKSLVLKKRFSTYKEIIGNSISKTNDYLIYLTSANQKKFAVVNFSFEKNTAVQRELELNLKKEKFVQTINQKNKFYILTVTRNSSNLNIYAFDEAANHTKHTLDLSEYDFIKNDLKTNLHRMLAEKTAGLSSFVRVNKIEKNTPISLELTSDNVKLYQLEDEIVFTFDYNKAKTELLSINLKQLTHDFQSIEKPKLNTETGYLIKSNSFLYNKRLYQIISTVINFEFDIKDIDSKKSIKNYKLTNKDSIWFKNSPIIQEGGAYASYREMEKTKKFLRKITNSKIGIAVYEAPNHFIITLGGNKEIASGAPMMMPMGGFGGIPIATAGAFSMSFNPTFYAFSSYTTTKSTYIDCLFDADFNHIKGEIEYNAFDMIDEFLVKDNIPEIGETVFKYKDFYILGHYKIGDKSYHLTKFEDYKDE